MSNRAPEGGPATFRADITPPLKWHCKGGKSYLAKKIIALMPPRCKKPNNPEKDDAGWLHYVEPYFGGGAVLLANDPEGISEVVNDLNQDLVNFWRALSEPACFSNFVRMLQVTPFSSQNFKDMENPFWPDSIERAVAFFVRCRQSLSGRMDSFAGITRTRTRRGMNEQVSAWLNAVEGLPEVHKRLRRVLILNKPAIDVIASEDGPRTLFYLDPPYLHETRATTGEYEHEMTEADHWSLLGALAGIKGRFLLSGYRSNLYDAAARRYGWDRHDFEIANHAAGGASKRRMTECVWCNY